MQCPDGCKAGPGLHLHAWAFRTGKLDGSESMHQGATPQRSAASFAVTAHHPDHARVVCTLGRAAAEQSSTNIAHPPPGCSAGYSSCCTAPGLGQPWPLASCIPQTDRDQAQGQRPSSTKRCNKAEVWKIAQVCSTRTVLPHKRAGCPRQWQACLAACVSCLPPGLSACVLWCLLGRCSIRHTQKCGYQKKRLREGSPSTSSVYRREPAATCRGHHSQCHS